MNKRRASLRSELACVFQIVRSVTRIAALLVVAIVTFLCIIMNRFDFKFAGHLDIFLFLSRAVGDNSLG